MSHRRPFIRRRSSSFDSSDTDEALDEEHQETLIADLAQSDEERSTLYRRVFLLLPLLCTLPFLLILFSPASSPARPSRGGSSGTKGTGARDRLLALLSVSSLLCTAWWLWYIPYDSSSRDVLGVSRISSLVSPSSSGRFEQDGEDDTFRRANGKRNMSMGWKEQAGARGDARGPLEKYLHLLNGSLAGVLLGTAVLLSMRGSSSSDLPGFDVWRWAVPGLVFALTAAVRQQLAPLDLQGLHQARYEYKGA